jgi:hypothetical protein
MIPDDKSFLRKAEQELYTVDGITPKHRSFLHDKKIEAADDWVESAPQEKFTPMNPMKKTSIFKKIFAGSLGFLLVAIIIAGLSYLSGNNAISTKNIDVTVTAKTFVDGGEALPVNVSIVNRNKINLELATLVLEYPEGNGSNPDAVMRISRDIGVVNVGDTHNESFSIKLYGEENSEKKITAHVEFRVPGSNAVYDKDEVVAVTIRTSPIRLTLDAPAAVIPNQEFPLKFSIIGNGTETLSNTALVLQYPAGFVFSKATPDPTTGSNVWYLGDIPPGANRTITVYGSIAGGVNDVKTIRASVGSQNTKNELLLDTVYNTIAQVVPLTNAFLDAKLVVGQDATSDIIPISTGESVGVSIPWQNTLSGKITNAQIEVVLGGSAYDPIKVQPGAGYFDSVNNKIIWSRQQVPQFGSIDPGSSGTVSFNIQPRQFNTGQIASNPVITMSINISGYDSAGVRQTALNIDKKTLAIGSDMNFIARTIHYSGPIQNSGAMPPKVNTETTYTLEWQLTNSRNRVTGVKVSTVLPTYVVWKNVVVPTSEQSRVSYNDVTKELIWNAGEIPAGTGNSLPPRVLSMKVGITPSVAQQGAIPNLTGDISVTGLDTFANKAIQITRRALDTQLSNDGYQAGYQGIVQ